jgi:hypothetical protein
VLGNDGITLYAAGQASLEQLISSNLVLSENNKDVEHLVGK